MVKAASLRWSELSENIPINNGCGFMVKNTSDAGGVYSVHVRPTPITLMQPNRKCCRCADALGAA